MNSYIIKHRLPLITISSLLVYFLLSQEWLSRRFGEHMPAYGVGLGLVTLIASFFIKKKLSHEVIFSVFMPAVGSICGYLFFAIAETYLRDLSNKGMSFLDWTIISTLMAYFMGKVWLLSTLLLLFILTDCLILPNFSTYLKRRRIR